MNGSKVSYQSRQDENALLEITSPKVTADVDSDLNYLESVMHFEPCARDAGRRRNKKKKKKKKRVRDKFKHVLMVPGLICFTLVYFD